MKDLTIIRLLSAMAVIVIPAVSIPLNGNLTNPLNGDLTNPLSKAKSLQDVNFFDFVHSGLKDLHDTYGGQEPQLLNYIKAIWFWQHMDSGIAPDFPTAPTYEPHLRITVPLDKSKPKREGVKNYEAEGYGWGHWDRVEDDIVTSISARDPFTVDDFNQKINIDPLGAWTKAVKSDTLTKVHFTTTLKTIYVKLDKEDGQLQYTFTCHGVDSKEWKFRVEAGGNNKITLESSPNGDMSPAS